MLRVFVQSLKILTIAAVALLVGAGGLRVFDFAVERFTPEGIGEPVSVTIADGENPDEVADRLAESGLIRSKFLFTTQMQLTRAGFQAGTYQLRKGMSAQQIIERITGGQTEVAQDPGEDEEDDGGAGVSLAAGETFEITVVEGWRTEQIAEEYERLGGEGGAEAFMQAVADVDRSQYEFLRDVPRAASLEGFLFPDTYTFRVDDAAANVATMLANFDTQFPPEWRERATQMGLDIYTVLTFASLVEREAQDPEERPTIADVYLSRYEQGWRLDADPTVQYAIGKRNGDWWPKPLTEEDLFIDSPYNTYQNEGLPPGPICNPGAASIQAVLEPAETDYMYFVAIGDTGEHAFAVTTEEHEANVDRYQRGMASE